MADEEPARAATRVDPPTTHFTFAVGRDRAGGGLLVIACTPNLHKSYLGLLEASHLLAARLGSRKSACFRGTVRAGEVEVGDELPPNQHAAPQL